MRIATVLLSAAVLSISLAASLSGAHAANELVLRDPDNLGQRAEIEIAGDGNRLVIEQSGTSSGNGNAISMSVSGDHNGGPLGSVFDDGLADLGLEPGSLSQSGQGNRVAMTIEGDRNLFAVSQRGTDNRVRGAIMGTGNQAAIVQNGIGNHVAFSQNGIGNMISIRQTSW